MVNYMELSEAQISAVRHNTGPALVIAGPGSGKTTVITNRVRTLIDEYNVNPSNILVITFSRAAAMEMKDRFVKMTDACGAMVTFGTFHAVYFMILKHSCRYKPDCIITPKRQGIIIEQLAVRHGVEYEDESEFISAFLSEISHVKNTGLDIHEFCSSICPSEIFRDIFMEYNRQLSVLGLIDFDDMLADCYKLLVSRDDIRHIWQEKYRYI
ncbi:MAG: UvrD-helicase domain-containing protein, partial [Eubacteriales bacterium]|nr:UvrD-helicase domain-containing protein [Eubacteriales bacterium]